MSKMSYDPIADRGCVGDRGHMSYDPTADRGCAGDRGHPSTQMLLEMQT